MWASVLLLSLIFQVTKGGWQSVTESGTPLNLSQSVLHLSINSTSPNESVLVFIVGQENRTTLYWNEGSGEVGLVMCSASNLKLVFPAIVAGVRTCSIAYTEHQLVVYFEGIEIGLWNMDGACHAMMSNTTQTTFKLSNGSSYLLTDRCSTNHYITVNNTCQPCTPPLISDGLTMTCVPCEDCGNRGSTSSSYCDANETSHIGLGEASWAKTGSNMTVTQPCVFNNITEGLNMSRRCQSNATWSAVDYSRCTRSANSHYLEALINDTREKKAIALDLEFYTYYPGTITNEDVEMVPDIINNIISEDVALDTAKYVLWAASNMVEFTMSAQYNNRLVDSLRQLSASLDPALKGRLIVADQMAVYMQKSNETQLIISAFCQNNFQDLITGCSQHDILVIDPGRAKRWFESAQLRELDLFLIFCQNDAYYPSINMTTHADFNTSVHAGEEWKRSIPSMVVDITLIGIDNKTKIGLNFNLHSDEAIKAEHRVWKSPEGAMIMIKYTCVKYNPANSSTGAAGAWDSTGCETKYNHKEDTPQINCICDHINGSFAIIATAEVVYMPDHHLWILLSIVGVAAIGLILAVSLLLCPFKMLTIPKTSKINISFVSLLMVVAVVILLRQYFYFK